MDGRVAAVEARRWPTGCPGRRAPRSARCPGPCARCGRSGGSGAGRRRRSPCAAISGRRSITSPNVPWRPGVRPSRAREQLVPGGEAGARPGRRSPSARGRGACRSRRSCAAGHRLLESRVEQHVELRRLVGGAGQPVERGLERGRYPRRGRARGRGGPARRPRRSRWRGRTGPPPSGGASPPPTMPKTSVHASIVYAVARVDERGGTRRSTRRCPRARAASRASRVSPRRGSGSPRRAARAPPSGCRRRPRAGRRPRA